MISPPQIQAWKHPHQLYRMQKNFPNVLIDLQNMHGDIFLLNLGVRRVLVLSHPEYARHVLIKRADNYTKQGQLRTPLRTVVDDGIVVVDGAEWRRRRIALQPTFARMQIAERIDDMATTVATVLDTLISSTETPLNVKTSNDVIHRLTAILTLKALCNQPTDMSLSDAMRSAYIATEQTSLSGALLSGASLCAYNR